MGQPGRGATAAQGPEPSRRRLTRAESRALTRQRLLDAAAEVFSARGFGASSVEDVAEAAGYSRGAVYSNFANKDELLMALLDQRIAVDMDRAEDLFARTPPDQRLAATARWLATLHDDESSPLALEFSLYAMRHPEARAAFQERDRLLREQVASLVARYFADLGLAPPLPPPQLAVLLVTFQEGIAMRNTREVAGEPDTNPYADLLRLMARPGPPS